MHALDIENSRRLSPVTAGLCFRETARNRGRLISKSAIWRCGRLGEWQRWIMASTLYGNLHKQGRIPPLLVPVPEDLVFVFCEENACALGKREARHAGSPSRPTPRDQPKWVLSRG